MAPNKKLKRCNSSPAILEPNKRIKFPEETPPASPKIDFNQDENPPVEPDVYDDADEDGFEGDDEDEAGDDEEEDIDDEDDGVGVEQEDVEVLVINYDINVKFFEITKDINFGNYKRE